MHTINDFYVHLPSNNLTDSSINTLCNYITHLQQPIILNGDWEVALTEISYTMSWYNVPGESTCSVFSFGTQVDQSSRFWKDKPGQPQEETKYSTPKQSMRAGESIHWISPIYTSIYALDGSGQIDDQTLKASAECILLYTIRIPPAYYTIEDMIEFINKEVLAEKDNLYDRVIPALELGKDGFVSAYTGKRLNLRGEVNREEDTFLNVYGPAADFLSFYWDSDEELRPIAIDRRKKYKITSSKRTEPKGGRYSLFVYTDIIRGVHVGDTMSNLLRIVDIPNNVKYGDQVVFRYERPEYKRVASNRIAAIQIYIKDDCGSDVPFGFGRTIVTLHFRKVKI
jgi:hypothetical protein